MPTGVEVTVSEGTVNVVNATGNDFPPSDAAITDICGRREGSEQADVHGRAEVIPRAQFSAAQPLLAWRKSSLYFQDQSAGVTSSMS